MAMTFVLSFVCGCVFLQENVSATVYQRPQTYIMKLNWASTAIKAHLQYQYSILQIIHSLPPISQTIKTLPRDWKNGSIWAFQTHRELCLCLQSPASPSRLFQGGELCTISSCDQHTPTKSQRSYRQIDPGPGCSGLELLS